MPDPTFLYQGSLQATTKVLNLWDSGTSTNLDPFTTAGGDYRDTAYDDSWWPTSSAASATNFSGNIGHTRNYPPGESETWDPMEPCAPWVTPPDVTAWMIMRSHFTLPSLPYRYYILEGFCEDLGGGFREFYVNGVTVPLAADGWKGVGDLLVPGDNVIALGKYGSGTTSWQGPPSQPTLEGWCGWRMTYYAPADYTKVWAWGTVTSSVNDKGVLGTGDTSSHLAPTEVTGVPTGKVSKVVSNGKSTIFLTWDGDIYGSGDNSACMISPSGTTDTSVHDTPTLWQFPSPSPYPATMFADIAIGGDCVIAVDRAGQLWTWGPNASGSCGTGNTTARTTPFRVLNGIVPFNAGRRVSAGKNFSTAKGIRSGFASAPIATGNNTYGQLGRSTSGTTETSFAAVATTNFPTSFQCIDVSAGDDQFIMEVIDLGGIFGPTPIGYLGCGRGEYGSLGGARSGASNSWFFTLGTGTNKINSTPRRSWQQAPALAQSGPRIQTCGPMLLVNVNVSFSGDVDDNAPIMWGDGVPAGAAADLSSLARIGVSPNTAIYGKSTYGGNDYSDVLVTSGGTSLRPVKMLAHYSGIQNPYSAGSSKAVGAGIKGDGTLWTWGYGGYGQMGNGGTTATNLAPASTNGLSDVLYAEVAFQTMFAIAQTAVPFSARGWVAVIG